jgi:phage terminase large subunit
MNKSSVAKAVEARFDYTPRALFLDFHQRSQRWALMVVHRRGGKTVACVADLVLRALYTKKTNARFGYVAPFRQQAKEIAWQYLKDMTEGLRSEPPRESELRVKLHNGSWITLYGADNPDALRGLYFDGLVLDEFGDMKPSLLGEVILPTLTDRKGWLAIIGTSKGRNQFFTSARKAEKSDDWFYKMARASETNLISENDLEEIRNQMTPEEYEQEFECSFDAAVKGTYYAHLINKAEKEQRVVTEPLFDPEQKVQVAADLGYSDSTAWWFWQRRPDGYAIIDYFESAGKDLKFYLKMLLDRGYNYQTIWLPHDAKAKTLQTGRSTVEQLLRPHRLLPDLFEPTAKLPIRLVPRLAVQHGIDAVRAILPVCYFHKANCFEGLEALRSYQRQWHDHNQVFSDKPLHNWASNGADGFRYFALVADRSRGQSAEAHLDRQPRGDRSLSKTSQAPRITLNDLYEDRETLSAGRRARRI